jgi:hypothetical protein
VKGEMNVQGSCRLPCFAHSKGASNRPLEQPGEADTELGREVSVIAQSSIGKEYPFSPTTYPMRLLARDASFYDAVCRGETMLPLEMERRLNACGIHLVSPNFFSSLSVHIYLGRGLTSEDETTAAPKLVDTGKQRPKNGPIDRKIQRRLSSSLSVWKLGISRKEL